jgi:hypothetical protein
MSTAAAAGPPDVVRAGAPSMREEPLMEHTNRCNRCKGVMVLPLWWSGHLQARLPQYDPECYRPNAGIYIQMRLGLPPFWWSERLKLHANAESRSIAWPSDLRLDCQACRYEWWLTDHFTLGDFEGTVILRGWEHVRLRLLEESWHASCLLTCRSEVKMMIEHFRDRQAEYERKRTDSKWTRFKRSIKNAVLEGMDINQYRDPH